MQWVKTSPLPYLLDVPADPGGHADWPVLCFLHGYDEAAPTPIREALTRHGPLQAAAAALTRDRFIVVAPQLPAGGDIWHRYAAEVAAIVAEAQGQHGGDPQRTYLTGFSYGANGVFDLALLEPERWAALWPVDPTRVPPSAPRPPVWLSFGEVSRRYHDRFVRLLGLEPAGPTAEGARLWLDEGASHVGSARRAYGDARIYDWLLRQPQGPAG